MNLTQKPIISGSLFLTALFTAAFALTATADMHREGMYVGMELGIAEQDDVTLNGRDNDVPTRCDQVLRDRKADEIAQDPANNAFEDLTVTTLAGGGACQRGQDVWDNRQDLDVGFIGGFQAGYMFGHLRAEVEYLYRNHSGENRENITGILGGKDQELVAGEQGLDSLSSHSVFANLYYDFTSDSRFTPYIGAGIGFSKIDYVYDAIFQRNLDPDNLGANTPHAAAGTTTDANEELSDEVFGWQIVIGSDYAIDESWSVGLKLRYQNFDDPEDSGRWNRLRGHDSVIAEDARLAAIRASDPSLADFDPTVTYHIEVEDIEVWAASLNLKYRF